MALISIVSLPLFRINDCFKVIFYNLHFKAFLQNSQLIQRTFYPAKTFGSHMGINLGSSGVFMARQSLYITQIDPIFQ